MPRRMRERVVEKVPKMVPTTSATARPASDTCRVKKNPCHSAAESASVTDHLLALNSPFIPIPSSLPSPCRLRYALWSP